MQCSVTGHTQQHLESKGLIKFPKRERDREGGREREGEREREREIERFRQMLEGREEEEERRRKRRELHLSAI